MARTDVVVFGAAYSVYTRSVLLALEEKGVDYRLQEVDIFASEGPPAGYQERHPFRRIPAFDHDGFRLYETSAITRYVDEAFAGPPLQPENTRDRALMNQAIAIMDAYGFRTVVLDIFVERVRVPQKGDVSDEGRISSALPKAETILRQLEAIGGSSHWLAGDRLTLADLHVAPMLILFELAPEGKDLMTASPKLAEWLNAVKARPAAEATRFPVEDQHSAGAVDGARDS